MTARLGRAPHRCVSPSRRRGKATTPITAGAVGASGCSSAAADDGDGGDDVGLSLGEGTERRRTKDQTSQPVSSADRPPWEDLPVWPTGETEPPGPHFSTRWARTPLHHDGIHFHAGVGLPNVRRPSPRRDRTIFAARAATAPAISTLAQTLNRLSQDTATSVKSRQVMRMPCTPPSAAGPPRSPPDPAEQACFDAGYRGCPLGKQTLGTC